jgi:hypothetical protein
MPPRRDDAGEVDVPRQRHVDDGFRRLAFMEDAERQFQFGVLRIADECLVDEFEDVATCPAGD